MKMLRWDEIKALLEARALRERAVLLVTVAIVIGYIWLLVVFDPVNASQANIQARINNVNNQIFAEAARYLEIQNSYIEDPDSFARSRLAELQTETMAVDNRLNDVFGQLIPPKEMSLVLITILQRETSLRLTNLQNLQAESLLSTTVNAVPLVGPAPAEIVSSLTEEAGLQVFKHGFRMEFEGDYLETIRYLQSLEELNSNFFWESLTYEVDEYPSGRIRLNIFTLSTERGWIGV